MPFNVIPPAVAMLFSVALMDCANNKWENIASLGVMLFGFVWFIQTMKEVC